MITIQDNANTKIIDNDNVKLTDVNNKTIEAKVSDIVDASTYLAEDKSEIYDSENTKVNMVCKITDSSNSTLTEEDLIDSVKAGKVNSLDVTFEATHSGRNLNDSVYESDSMEQDCSSFLYPYSKPLIKNHNSYEEPLGRVIDSNFGESELVDDRDTINVTFRVSSQDAMEKFADGRYRTMSVGASCKNVKCNVCGKYILKDNKFKFCGHWKGYKYGDQVATWTYSNITYREGSVVNSPADVYAQVKGIKANMKKGDTKMKTSSKDSFDNVDGILNSTKDSKTENKDNPNPVKDNKNDKDDKAKGDNSESLKKLQDELKSEKEKYKTDMASKDNEIKTLKASAIVADADLVKSNKLNVKLAELNKDLLCDSLKMLDPKITDEDLQDKTVKELGKMFCDFQEQANTQDSNDDNTGTQRKIGNVKNPSAAVKDNKKETADDDDDDDASNQEANMKDFEGILNKFFRVD